MEDRTTYNHGAYPQRYKGFSVGSQDSWGWFQHLNTTADKAWDLVVFTDWHMIFRDTCSDCDLMQAEDDGESEVEDDSHLMQAIEQNALATFVDAHKTSYYVNSYTTKVNVSMDEVLGKLLDGVE